MFYQSRNQHDEQDGDTATLKSDANLLRMQFRAHQLREREKFYEYDLSDRWQHQLRMEAIAYSDQLSPSPLCLAG